MRRLVYIFFFFSGLCGLVYEVLWVRLFVLVMGGTVYSFTTVLVAFMSGLALGGWLGGRYADRMKRSPLLVYGILEGLIGVYCLLIPVLIRSLNPVFDFLYPIITTHNLLGLMARFIFSGLILLFPTTLMGATLPILVRYVYRVRERFGQVSGSLYSVNTLGAVLGSFISGFILIPVLGQIGTLYLTAVLNFLIMALVIVLWRLEGEGSVSVPERLVEDEGVRRLNFRAGMILLGYFLSGFSAMVYQVAWSRALVLSLGTTLYVLGLILTGYILGLGLGAMVMSWIVDRFKRGWLWVGVIEVLIGLFAWGVVPLFGRLPLWLVFLFRPRSYWGWMGIEFLVGLGLIFLPTFLMGGLFPLVSRLFQEERGGVGVAVGGVYSWNTVGAILGSFVCGFVLIGSLGLRDSLVLASVLSLLIGGIFILGERVNLLYRVSGLGGVLVLVLGFIWFRPGWEPEVISSGPYIYYKGYTDIESVPELKDYLKSELKTLYHKEGVEATVSVFKVASQKTLALRINGKTDASTSSDMTTQIFTGHLPALLHQAPKKAMVIGLASGITLGSLLTHPIEKVDCLEISPEVVEASKFFDAVSGRPLKDPRTNLIVNDGRFHLAHTKERYDVIISEPSNPWIGGMGLLFTKEFFEQARARLEPDGIMLIWVGVYDLNLESVRMITRTFLEVFPEASLWQSIPGSDYLLIGFNNRLEINYSQLQKKLEDWKIASDLERVNLRSAERIISRFMMGPEELRRFSGEGAIHLDDRRQLEFQVPRMIYQMSYERNVLPVLKVFNGHWVSPKKYMVFEEEHQVEILFRIESFFNCRRLMMEALVLLVGGESPELAIQKLYQAYQIDPEEPWITERIQVFHYTQGQTFLMQGKYKRAVEHLTKVWEIKPEGAEIPDVASYYFFEEKNYENALKWAEQGLEKDYKDPLAWLNRGRAELGLGKPAAAFNSFQSAFNSWSQLERYQKSPIVKILVEQSPVDLNAVLLLNMGEAKKAQNKIEEALIYYEQALVVEPDYVKALVESAKILTEFGQYEKALLRFDQALKLERDNGLIYFFYGQALAKAGKRQEAVGALRRSLSLLSADLPERKQVEKELSGLLAR